MSSRTRSPPCAAPPRLLPLAKTPTPRAADGDHPARREAARPADQRHFRCIAPRCELAPRTPNGRHRPSSCAPLCRCSNDIHRDDTPEVVPTSPIAAAPAPIAASAMTAVSQVIVNLSTMLFPSRARPRFGQGETHGERDSDRGGGRRPGIPPENLERIFERSIPTGRRRVSARIRGSASTFTADCGRPWRAFVGRRPSLMRATASRQERRRAERKSAAPAL
jgi:hypothetical protein